MNPILVLFFLLLTGYSAAPLATLITDFEFNDTSGLFSLTGSAGESATFSGGEAKSIGVPSLYHSGVRSWMVGPGKEASINFVPPARELTLFLRTQSSETSNTLELLDADGNILASFSASSDSWLEVDVNEATLGAAIHKAIVRNQGSEGYVVVDDLTYQPVEVSPPTLIEKGQIRLRLKQVASGLTAPNWAVAAPGDKTRLYVGDQAGKLWRVNLADGSKEVFLDFSTLLVPLGIFGNNSFDERGFLGFAFHPGFEENGLLYTYTSEPAFASGSPLGTSDFSTLPGGLPDHVSVVREWRVDPDFSNLDPATLQGRILLTVDQPQFNHNAGALNFGPDGLLYIALGDGGGADDRDGQDFLGSPMVGHGPDGNGQNPGNPLGSLLRIDPAGSNSMNQQYGIPADNPFVGSETELDEIYAYGFRNPFRFSFDSVTGTLFLADVGQNDIEEVNLIHAGGNYGWALKEGSFRFEPNGNEPGFVTDETVEGDLIDPVAQYDHDEGTAVIGGFVYRGSAIPELYGKYVFGDLARTGNGDGRLFYLDGSTIRELDLTEQDQPGFWVLGFGQDADGEVYVLGNTTGVPFGTTGALYKLIPNARFDFTHLEIPAVDVTFALGGQGVFQARLKFIQGSKPLRFELIQAARLAENFSEGDATFDEFSGTLVLPFVNVIHASGNVSTYSATLRRDLDASVMTFELERAEFIK